MSKIGDLLRQEREQKNWTPQYLALLIGYKNVNKGARLIGKVENSGKCLRDIRSRMIAALSIPSDIAELAISQDNTDAEIAFQKWVNAPVQPQLIARYMPAIYLPTHIPQDLKTQKDIEEFSCQFAKERHIKVCLKFSRRQTSWINENGEVYARTETTMEDPWNGPRGGLRDLGGGEILSIE